MSNTGGGMAMQPDPEMARNGFDTVEHDNLSEVVEMLSLLERLRRRGLDDLQVAREMQASPYDPPGGGNWEAPLVAKVLGVVNAVRSEQDRTDGPVAMADRDPSTKTGAITHPISPRRPSPRRAPYHPEPTPALSGAGLPQAPPMRRPDAEVGTSRVSPRLLAAALLVLSVTAFGALAVTALRDRNGTTITNTPADGNAVADRTADGRIDSTAAGQNDDNRTATDATDTTTITATTTTTAAADPADMMAIRVEPEGPDATDPVTGRSVEAATATIRADGLLHLEGAFPSRADADRYIAGLADVFGRDNIVETYEINPASPLPDASDVALDKPVLFQSGTATIAPEYIPFLEACGDVLRLNPHITMSISAFTDATGPEDLNLELSRQRAQAIHDFYRSVDVSESQLQSLAFGEAEPVADNDTPDGREQNRRAVLRLLGVLAADSADQDRGN